MPQMTAVSQVADVAAEHGVPVIADGGIRYSGDAIKALAAGAKSAVMLGSYFAGTDEAPGRITMQGKKYKVQAVRGMGSVGAMKSGGGDRYLKEEDEDEEFVPEGVEAATPTRGASPPNSTSSRAACAPGWGTSAPRRSPELHDRAEFIRVSSAGQTEGHPTT